MQREVPSGSVATATRGPQWGRGAWEGKGEMDEHTALFWEGAFHLRVPHIPLPLPQDDGKVMAQEPGAPIQEKALSLVPLSVPKGTALGVPLVDFKFQVPAVTASGRWAGGGVAAVAGGPAGHLLCGRPGAHGGA